MLIGQSLLSETTPGLTYTGPWMPRQADKATFLFELLYVQSTTVDIKVEHKNSEDPDSSAMTAVTLSSQTTAGTHSGHASGLKELVRYVYTLTADTGTKWVHLRANPPIWQPN